MILGILLSVLFQKGFQKGKPLKNANLVAWNEAL